MIPCPSCGLPAALLIFAENAITEGDIEDYARNMYVHYSDLNVPTWIIGQSLGTPSPSTPSNILKVWPIREGLSQLSAVEFNKRLDKMLLKHCCQRRSKISPRGGVKVYQCSYA